MALNSFLNEKRHFSDLKTNWSKPETKQLPQPQCQKHEIEHLKIF
jgi:hypothetical protein